MIAKSVYVAAIALACAAGAQAAHAQSVFTSLKEPACQGAAGNAAARKTEHAPVVLDCRGAGGWRVHVIFHGASVTAGFIAADSTKPALELHAGYDIGPRIEWRSRGKSQPPHAAIVRLHERTGQKTTASALAILGVRPGSMCLAAIIDAGANKNANQLAQKQADELRDGNCPEGSPRLIGAATEAGRALLDRNL